MARLVLLRHAKSDYPVGVPDHDRPLSDRGRREAPLAGRWLAENVPDIELVIVSTATRTQQTWALVSAELSSSPAKRDDARVYDASVHDLLAVLADADDSVGTVLVVGHNPGLEDLAASLAGGGDPDALDRLAMKFPTSAIAVLDTRDVQASLGQLRFGDALLSHLVVPRP